MSETTYRVSVTQRKNVGGRLVDETVEQFAELRDEDEAVVLWQTVVRDRVDELSRCHVFLTRIEQRWRQTLLDARLDGAFAEGGDR